LEEKEEFREVHLKYLREKIQKGVDSGSGHPADEVFSRVEAKYSKVTSRD